MCMDKASLQSSSVMQCLSLSLSPLSLSPPPPPPPPSFPLSLPSALPYNVTAGVAGRVLSCNMAFVETPFGLASLSAVQSLAWRATVNLRHMLPCDHQSQ